MATEDRWVEGGCFCGEIRLRVRGLAVWKAGCTCRTCVRMHAAPYVVWAGFDRANFEFLRGVATAFRSSPHAIRRFCGRCGTTLTYAKDAAGVAALEAAARVMYVAVAALDDPAAYPPDEIVHGLEKIAWMGFDGRIPIRTVTSPDAAHLQFAGMGQNPSSSSGEPD